MRLPGGAAEAFAAELEIAAAGSGVTQRQIATRARVSQSFVSRVQRRLIIPDLAVAERLASATGHRLSIKLLPGDGLRLRDTGQLRLAEVIREQAHPHWRVSLEVPAGLESDRRAADMVLTQTDHAMHIEIERWLRDLQAQLRRAQLKRMALTERLGRPVRLILALPDSRSTRLTVGEHAALIKAALPASSRVVWAAIRSGEGLAQDGLLFVRAPRRPSG
jgi:transcriptional regulator with XRE-family HTH domain